MLLCSTVAVRADDDEYSRRSLAGLKGIAIFIPELPPEVEQSGLMNSAIRTDVELKLRQSGIHIIGANEGDGLSAVLTVGVEVLPSGTGLWAYDVNVDVRQVVVLARDPSIRLPLNKTWSSGAFGTVGKLNVRNLREQVKDQVDKFINAYLSVNPKK